MKKIYFEEMLLTIERQKIYDSFAGSGTTLLVAKETNRTY
jgi:DNA modification methylase